MSAFSYSVLKVHPFIVKERTILLEVQHVHDLLSARVISALRRGFQANTRRPHRQKSSSVHVCVLHTHDAPWHEQPTQERKMLLSESRPTTR